MALAVCLLFDAQGDRLIRLLWQRLDARGFATPLTHTHGRHRPHLSLAVLREWQLPAVRDALGALPDGDPVELNFQGILAFPRGRVSLATAVSSAVVARQEAVAQAVIGAGSDLHKHYQPRHWIPHVSVVAGGSAESLPAVAVTVTDALPIVVRAVEAALIDSSTGAAWPMTRMP